MKRDGGDAQVPQHERHPLGVVTRATENHEGVPGQLVQDGHKVTVLQLNRQFKTRRQKNKTKETRSRPDQTTSYLILGWNKDIVLLQLVYCGVLCGYGALYRILQSCSLELLDL